MMEGRKSLDWSFVMNLTFFNWFCFAYSSLYESNLKDFFEVKDYLILCLARGLEGNTFGLVFPIFAPKKCISRSQSTKTAKRKLFWQFFYKKEGEILASVRRSLFWMLVMLEHIEVKNGSDGPGFFLTKFLLN